MLASIEIYQPYIFCTQTVWSLVQLADMLQQWRINKSHMVNLNQVMHLKMGKKPHVVLPNDIEVPVSHDRLTDLKQALSIQA